MRMHIVDLLEVHTSSFDFLPEPLPVAWPNSKSKHYSCIPVSLLTFATVISDSLSYLHFIKIYSSRETLTSSFLLCAHPKKRNFLHLKCNTTSPQLPLKVLIFVTEMLHGEKFVSGRNHASLWSDKEMAHYQQPVRAKWKDDWWKPLSGVTKEKSAPDTSRRRWTWYYHANWEETNNRKNLISHLLNQHRSWFSLVYKQMKVS